MSISLKIGAVLGTAAMLAPSASAQGYQLEERPARWRFSIESIDVKGVGDGSLLGVHYELLDVFDTPGLFAGLGAYGSLTGDLGGFFAGGLDVGWRHALNGHFSVEAGTFVGTGGGRDAALGASGLLLRPFVAIERGFERFGLRLELANTNLNGSDFNELAVSLGLTLPVSFLTGRQRSSWTDPISTDALELNRWELEAGFAKLKPTSGSSRIDGSALRDNIQLAGIKLNAQISDSSHIPVEAWGAVDGEVAGFRALMAGYGRHGAFFESAFPGILDWELEVLAGVAGGGSIDTGGGMVVEGTAGLRARFAPNWTGHVALVYFDAPTGDLTATGLQFGVAWDPRMLRLSSDYDRSQLATRALPESEGLFDVWQLGAAYKVYHPRTGSAKKSGAPLDTALTLTGVSAERHVNEYFSVLVRAFGAVGGNIGGYSEGLGGLRVAASPFDFLHGAELYAEYDLGAGGGGDVDVGSGLIQQSSVGVAWSPVTGVELGVGVGRMGAAFGGNFSSSLVEAGISFDVARLIARN